MSTDPPEWHPYACGSGHRLGRVDYGTEAGTTGAVGWNFVPQRILAGPSTLAISISNLVLPLLLGGPPGPPKDNNGPWAITAPGK